MRNQGGQAMARRGKYHDKNLHRRKGSQNREKPSAHKRRKEQGKGKKSPTIKEKSVRIQGMGGKGR